MGCKSDRAGWLSELSDGVHGFCTVWFFGWSRTSIISKLCGLDVQVFMKGLGHVYRSQSLLLSPVSFGVADPNSTMLP